MLDITLNQRAAWRAATDFRVRLREEFGLSTPSSEEVFLECQAKHGYDAIHRLILPSDSTASIGCVVPKAGTRRVETCPSFLHNNTCHDIFKLTVLFAKLAEYVLHGGIRPLGHLR